MVRTPLNRRQILAAGLIGGLPAWQPARAGTTWRVGPGEALTRVADALQQAQDGDTIAVLELDPTQGETVINSTRLGTLSLVLRSIADYAQTTEIEKKNNVNRPIRMIRFGRGQDISSPGTGAEVTAASYDGEGSDENATQQPATGE